MQYIPQVFINKKINDKQVAVLSRHREIRWCFILNPKN